MTIGGKLRSGLIYAAHGLVAAGICGMAATDSASSAPSEWQQIKTGASPKVISLSESSYIEFAPRSSANITYHKNQPSIVLSKGRLNANLFADANISARLSASQVFIRASEGNFFMIADNGITTIGVCRGTISAYTSKSSASSLNSAGEFTITAGEQAIVSGDGAISKEPDDALDCTGS